MQSANGGSRAALIVFIAGASVAFLFIGTRHWLAKDQSAPDRAIAPASPVVDSRSSSEQSAGQPTEQARVVVDVQASGSESSPSPQAQAIDEGKLVAAPESSVSANSHFPYGRPTPDWVFEQKYAGMSPEEIQSAKEMIESEYKLSSKKAFNERFDAGDYEVIPEGESIGGAPGDDRIISGRSLPNSRDTQVVRLDVDKHPEVYELWYEYLWLSTQR